jgi:signal transduction histidine kinase
VDLADVLVIDKSQGAADDISDVRMFLEELANDDRASCRRRASEHPTPSCVGARLRLDNQAIGSICLFDKQDGTQFTEEDEQLLELFGAQAALAISYSRQLQRAEEAQQRLASLHDELSAVIAHDMRSPISSMLLQIDLLMDGGDSAPDQVFVPTAALDRLRRAAQRLSRMAEDLLDASRIELGRVALERRQVSLRDVIGNLVAQLEPTFGGRPVEIDANADAPLVFADPLRLDEIVTNLLENAAKYSMPGRPIKVRIQRDGGGATVTVKDEGSGISGDELPKLFDRFFQAKRLRSKKAGLGLGLYITKGLVEAHGGRIWVDSVVGQGSQFHVWLPSDIELDAEP